MDTNPGRIRLRALAAAGAAALLAAVAQAGDRPMQGTLEIKVLQSGFGGESGTLYRIEPTGSYTASSIVAGEEAEVVRRGTVDSGSMIQLSHRLETADLASLPEQETAYTGVNPASVELSYEAIERRLTLPPGYQPGEDCGAELKAAWCPVLRLLQAVTQVTGQPD